MSWLTDLAGKAEGLLNQLDQSAADALLKADISLTKSTAAVSSRPTAPAPTYFLSTNDYSPDESMAEAKSVAVGQAEAMTEKSFHPASSASFGTNSPRKDYKSSGYASSVTSSILSKEPRAVDPDDQLLDYLNSGAVAHPPLIDSSAVVVSAAARTAPMSRRSSSSSLRSLPIPGKGADSSVPTVPLTPDPEIVVNWNPTSTMATGVSLRSSEQDPGSPMNQNRSKEADLTKLLKGKDAQIAVLRVKIQEVTAHLDSKTKALVLAEKERDRLHEECATVTAKVASASVSEAVKRAERLEQEVEQQRNDGKLRETDLLSRAENLEAEKVALSQQLITAERSLTDERLKTRDAFDQLKLAKYNLEANKQEFDEYKQKAQRILQSKEKLIETLKGGVRPEDSSQSEMQVLLAELEQERDLLREDLQQSQIMQYNMKTELQELESQLASEQRHSLETARDLQEQTQAFQEQAAQYREQMEHFKQELKFLQEEMSKQQIAVSNKLQQKDGEIERLTNQVAYKAMSSQSESELEGRIRSLTENLIQKQALIEQLQTERSSLYLQLEKTERMYKEAESAAVQSATTSVYLGNGEEAYHRPSAVPSFLRESPFDTSVTKQVKKAYTTLDRLSPAAFPEPPSVNKR